MYIVLHTVSYRDYILIVFVSVSYYTHTCKLIQQVMNFKEDCSTIVHDYLNLKHVQASVLVNCKTNIQRNTTKSLPHPEVAYIVHIIILHVFAIYL